MSKEIGEQAGAWWAELQPVPERGIPGDRGSLAALRRATTLAEAASVQAAHRLRFSVKAAPYEIDRIMAVAMVLASVRTNDTDHSVARLLATKHLNAGRDRPLLSPIRFKLLMRANEHEGVVRQFRRMVRLLDDTVNVPDLAQSIFDWTDEWCGERCRYRWQLDYHGALEGAQFGNAADAA